MPYEPTIECDDRTVRQAAQAAQAALAAYERQSPLAVAIIRWAGLAALTAFLSGMALGLGSHELLISVLHRFGRETGETWDTVRHQLQHEVTALFNPPPVHNPAILDCMERLTGERPPTEDPKAMIDYFSRHFD